MKTDLFQSHGLCWVFQIFWHIKCSTFTASSFRIWNNSTKIPSPPLALFVVMLPKAHLTSHSRMSGCRWVISPSWLSGSWRSFLYSSSVYSCHFFLISSASVRFISFPSFIELPFAWSVPLVSLIPWYPSDPRSGAHNFTMTLRALSGPREESRVHTEMRWGRPGATGGRAEPLQWQEELHLEITSQTLFGCLLCAVTNKGLYSWGRGWGLRANPGHRRTFTALGERARRSDRCSPSQIDLQIVKHISMPVFEAKRNTIRSCTWKTCLEVL